jgi:hypothetical protein
MRHKIPVLQEYLLIAHRKKKGLVCQEKLVISPSNYLYHQQPEYWKSMMRRLEELPIIISHKKRPKGWHPYRKPLFWYPDNKVPNQPINQRWLRLANF